MRVQQYCLGFAFSGQREFVLLIRKNRPSWAKGLLNGLGGRVNDDERPHAAMVREFREECGLLVPQWREFAQMTGNGSEVRIFEAAVPNLLDAKSTTDESVTMLRVTELMRKPKMAVPSVDWLVRVALDRSKHLYITSTRTTYERL